MDKIIETTRKNREPSMNTLGYEILTPSGFQPFDGVAYKGLVAVLEFKTKNYNIKVSYKHRFDSTAKIAKDYKIGDILDTQSGPEEILEINKAGKTHVYDMLEVSNGNIYLANGIQNHNCDIIRDETKTVIPEFDDQLISEIVKEVPKPAFYTPYVAMDLGFKDLTVCLFGYYDFKTDTIVIEDEICKKGKDLKLNKFAEEIIAKENNLWINMYTNEIITPEVRVSDLDLIVIQEINRASYGQLNFIPVTKEPGYKLPLINKIRVMLQSNKIIINPRCTTLVRHLKNARWKDASTKDTFARSPDDGHYDAVDAMIYLIKSISYNKNPYPRNYGVDSSRIYYPPNVQQTTEQSTVDIYKSIFGRKKR